MFKEKNKRTELETLYASKDSAEKHSKIVLLNPSDYNSWNYLKKLVERSENSTMEIKTQLDLSKNAINSNPRAYAAWFHRFYLFKRWNSEWFKEHQLCNLLLQFDPRNFHCWNYCLKNKFTIKEDLHNYTSMHLKPFLERHLFIDPNDEGVWRLFEKRRSQEYTNFFGIMRRYENYTEVIFNDVFNGVLAINGSVVNQKTLTKRLVFLNNEWQTEDRISLALQKSNLNIKREFLPCIINKILLLDERCIYALRQKLIYSTGDERRGICTKLQFLDPLRKGYYKWLTENECKIYILTL